MYAHHLMLLSGSMKLCLCKQGAHVFYRDSAYTQCVYFRPFYLALSGCIPRVSLYPILMFRSIPVYMLSIHHCLHPTLYRAAGHPFCSGVGAYKTHASIFS